MSTPYQFTGSDTVQELQIERFAGVDFSGNETKIDWSRSPDACNMIADDSGYPVKRTGYRRKYQFSGSVYGIHVLDNTLLCHAGTELYRVKDNGTVELLYLGMNTARSVSFVMNGKLWLLDGKTYLVYDGTRVQPVRNIAYVPTTTIGSPPEGGGTTLEAVNLLTPKRINTFVGDGKTKVFQLDCEDMDVDSVSCKEYAVDWVNAATGRVYLKTAPPDAGGLSNVTIQFSKTTGTSCIDACRIFGMYGGQNDTRVFVSGDSAQPNVDWQSGLYDPSYFPDLGYTKIGSDSSAIMGYVRQYDTQLVLKSDGQDAKQYLRSFSLDENDKPAFSLHQGAEAAGAVSMAAIVSFHGTPYYLSAEGVMGIYGTNVSERRIISGVSQRIDPKLCRQNLSEAVAFTWNGMYYLAVGGQCYVADGRQMENGIPEWYYWENIPAVCFAEYQDALWFGTADGRLCMFCQSLDTDAYLDDGQPIHAYWTTPFSDLGTAGQCKTILSCQPIFMPFGYSGAEVYGQTEKFYQKLTSCVFSQFTFAQMDFSRFSFRSAPNAVPVPIKRHIRRAYLFQVIMQNNHAEPFGLLGLHLRYQMQSPARRLM